MIIRSGKIAHREPVSLGRLAKKVDPRPAAGASHVLHDNRRIAGYMLGQMARDDSPFNVGRTAGGEIDDEVYVFPLVKRLLRRGRSSTKKDQTHESKDKRPKSKVHSQSSFLITRALWAIQ